MEYLDVLNLWPWIGHPSFEAAVQAGKPYSDLAVELNERLHESCVQDACCSDDALHLLLRNKGVLTIALDERRVGWSLVEPAAWTSTRAAAGTAKDVLHLRFSGGNEYIWDRGALVRELIGREFKAIAPSESIISLYLDNYPDLLFDGFRFTKTDQRLLFFSEE